MPTGPQRGPLWKEQRRATAVLSCPDVQIGHLASLRTQGCWPGFLIPTPALRILGTGAHTVAFSPLGPDTQCPACAHSLFLAHPETGRPWLSWESPHPKATPTLVPLPHGSSTQRCQPGSCRALGACTAAGSCQLSVASAPCLPLAAPMQPVAAAGGGRWHQWSHRMPCLGWGVWAPGLSPHPPSQALHSVCLLWPASAPPTPSHDLSAGSSAAV